MKILKNNLTILMQPGINPEAILIINKKKGSVEIMTMDDKPQKLKELEEREARARAMGGEKEIQKQHAGGKLTARERLELLFDPGTFQIGRASCRERV